MKKKNLGQFFTTNVNYILQGFEGIIKDKDVIDPFAGNGDLLNWAKLNGANSVIGYDIDKKYIKDNISVNDSLTNIPKTGNFNLTNPPYLAKNKMSKSLKNKYLSSYEIDDFYLLAIKKIIEAEYDEGLIIIPINFFSAENSDKIRKEFLSIYNIDKINYFTEQVFDDTTYNVVAFHYIKDNINNDKRTLNIKFLPENKIYSFDIYKDYSYRIGGNDIHSITSCQKVIKIKRLTNDIITANNGKYKIDGYYNDYKTNEMFYVSKSFSDKIKNNIITLNCIDGKNDNKICAEDIRFYKKDCLVGKNTSRNIAYILIDDISIEEQSKLIYNFNKKLNTLREKYNSLFLTNFRDNNRKRISFDFCYQLLNYCFTIDN